MATTGYFVGSAKAGVLAAEFGAGRLFDAALSAVPGVLSYSPVGEFEQSGFVAAQGALLAAANFSAGVFSADLTAAQTQLAADFGVGRAFTANLLGVANLSADWLPGDLFDGAFVAASGGLDAGVRKGGVFEAALIGRSELAAVVSISPTGEVISAWVVNLTTGGHARYVGALDGSEQVDAYVVTPATDFGSPQEKLVSYIYAHMRSTGTTVITTVTDEQQECVGNDISDDGRAGVHRRGDKRPRGLKGGTWQIKFSNVDGSDFLLRQLEVTPVSSARISR